MWPLPMTRGPHHTRTSRHVQICTPSLVYCKAHTVGNRAVGILKCFLVLHDICNEFSRKTDSLTKCFRRRKNWNGIPVFLDNDPLLSVSNMNEINAKYNRTRRSRRLMMQSSLSRSWVHCLTWCTFVLRCVHNLLTVTITNTFSHLYVSADNYRPQTKFAKVMFYRCLSVHRGVCMVAPGGGICGCSGGGGHAWLLPGGMCGCSWGGGVHGCSKGGVHGCSQGACVVAPRGHVWLLPGGTVAPWGVCVVAPGGACVVAPGGCGCSWGHAWLLPGGCAWLLPRGGMHGIWRDTEIRSMSGRYASHWNAFLFL